MARKRYKPEEIVSLLRQAEVLHGQGGSWKRAPRRRRQSRSRTSRRGRGRRMHNRYRQQSALEAKALPDTDVSFPDTSCRRSDAKNLVRPSKAKSGRYSIGASTRTAPMT